MTLVCTGEQISGNGDQNQRETVTEPIVGIESDSPISTFFLSGFADKYSRLGQIRRWIEDVSKQSGILPTLTKRGFNEINNILLSGHGDVLFIEGEDEQLIPVSILLLTETFSVIDQLLLFSSLDIPRPLEMIHEYTFYESSLGYTDPRYRGLGLNSILRGGVYHYMQRSGCVIVGSTCNPIAMKMLARRGLVPIDHEAFPLATTLLSFSQYPVTFGGYKPVPLLNKVEWMSSEETARLRVLLAEHLSKERGNRDIAGYPDKPVLFVSMDERGESSPSPIVYSSAQPHRKIHVLEDTLKEAISMSSVFGIMLRGGECLGEVAFLHGILREFSMMRGASGN